MKALVFVALMVLGLNSAFAAVQMRTDCGGFGPELQRLVVQDTGLEGFMTLGYEKMGRVHDLSIKGCDRLTRQGDLIYCGDTLIGKTGRFQASQARLSLSRALEAQIVGSCAPEKHQSLTMVVRR